MSDHKTQHSALIDSSPVLKDDEEFVMSDSRSTSTVDSTSTDTDEAFQPEVDEALPNKPQDPQPEVNKALPNEPQVPQPEITQLVNKGLTHPRRFRSRRGGQAKQEQALSDSISAEFRKMRIRVQNPHNLSDSSADTNEFGSGLTPQTSTLKIDPETEDPVPEPASSTNGQNQRISADQQSGNEQLGQDFARQNASNQNLQQSLADSDVRTKNQPPADDCSARLQDLQARLEQKRLRELKQQAARMFKGFENFTEFWQENKDAELAKAAAKATAKVLVEKRRMQETMSRMEKEMAATYAELEMQEKFSRHASWTIQSLQDREKGLGEDKRRLFHSKKELEASLSLKAKDCRDWSGRAMVLKASLVRAEQTVEAVDKYMMNMAEAKEVAEADARILHAANLALKAEKRELEEKSRTATAQLNAAFPEMNRCQTQLQLLNSEVERVGDRLAEREATIKRDADEIRELKESMDGWLKKRKKWKKVVRRTAEPPRESPVVKEVEKGERATDHFLGSSKSILKSQFPPGRDSVFSFFVGLALLVLAFTAASATNRERQIWQGLDEVTRRAVISLRAENDPELLWQDPFLDVSRGMYGV